MSAAARCASRTWSMPISLRVDDWAEERSMLCTSGCCPAAMRTHWEHSPHGRSPVSTRQFTACAKIIASVALPTLGGPTNRYACDSFSLSMLLERSETASS